MSQHVCDEKVIDGKRLRILIVENNKEVGRCLFRALSRIHSVTVCTFPLEVVLAMEKCHYDCLLAGNNFGQDELISGLELVEAIMTCGEIMKKMPNPRFIIMSGGGAINVPQGVGFISKPFDITTLLKLLESRPA
jgi:CheY-like chemotaxis protein